MDTVQEALGALRQEIEALREDVRALRRPAQSADAGPLQEGWADAALRQLRDQLRGSGTERGIGFVRAVVVLESAGSATGGYGTVTWSSAGDVPDSEAVGKLIREFAGNALALGTLRALALRFFAGQPMEASADELASELNVTTEQVRGALDPLVRHGWVTRASDVYAYAHSDDALLLLTMP